MSQIVSDQNGDDRLLVGCRNAEHGCPHNVCFVTHKEFDLKFEQREITWMLFVFKQGGGGGKERRFESGIRQIMIDSDN